MEIRIGDTVRITGSKLHPFVIQGSVLSVQNTWNFATSPPTPAEWGLEVQDTVRGYVYWKQWTDGGTVEVLGE